MTGGASGLGHATVSRLTKLGTKVVFCDLPTSKGQEIAQQFGDNVTYVPANVSKEIDVQNVIDEIERLHGRLNVVVNCAGLSDAHPIYNFNRERPRSLTGFQNILAVSGLKLRIHLRNEGFPSNQIKKIVAFFFVSMSRQMCWVI